MMWHSPMNAQSMLSSSKITLVVYIVRTLELKALEGLMFVKDSNECGEIWQLNTVLFTALHKTVFYSILL